MANSGDPDLTPHSAVSDMGLQCLQRPICPNTCTSDITVVCMTSDKKGYLDNIFHTSSLKPV